VSTQGLIENVIFIQGEKGGGVVIQRREFKFSLEKTEFQSGVSLDSCANRESGQVLQKIHP